MTVLATTDGTYNLDLVSSGHGITDSADNPLTDTAPTTGTDQTYTVSTVPADTTSPTISSIERHDPAVENTDSQTLVYRVTFSEDVTGVDAADFALSSGSTGGGTSTSGQFNQTRSPALAITSDNTVSDTITVPDSGTATSVSVTVDVSHTYIGDLKIDLITPDGTTKTLHNRSGYGADDIDQTYAPDFGSVSIAGTWTLRINDNYAAADDGTLNSWMLTINHSSTASHVTTVSGSGDTYHVTVSAPADGTYNLDLVSSGHGIADTASNPLTNTTPTGADETYTVSTEILDSTNPTLESIERYSPASQNTDSQTLVYSVTFSENVTGVTASDFALSPGSTGGTGASPVTGVSGSGDTYHVTVLATTDGTYNLDLVSSGHGITDSADNPLTDTAPTTGTDQTYTVSTVPADTTSPTISSIERHDPAVENTDSQTLVYRVTFSEDVTGVDAADFALSPGSTGTSNSGRFTQARSPSLAIPYNQTVSDAITVTGSGSVASVNVTVDITHTYRGDLKVDLVSPDGTVKTLHNRAGGNGDDINKTYAPDFGGIQAAGVWTLRMHDNYDADSGTLNRWTLTVDYDSGTTGPVASISGSGSQYLATVLASGDGTYNLDLKQNSGIEDAADNPLTSTSPTGADHTYTVSTAVIDNTAPRLASIERSSPATQTTDSQTLVYRVTFSENVTGVDAADFALSSGSTGGGTSTSGQFNQTRSPALAITSDNTVSDTITVPDSGTATSVSVAVDVSHTYIGDLKVDLIAPDGTTKTLHNRSGNTINNINKTYVPDFGSVSIAGTWTLRINDNYAAADDGTLNSWMLTINHNSTASHVTTVSGSGDTYHVTVLATTDGTYNLDLKQNSGIADAAANPLSGTIPTGEDQSYTVHTSAVHDVSANTLPLVNAGPDQTVLEGSTVTLNGTASDHDGNALTYSWGHDSASAIEFANSTARSTTFTAPWVGSNSTVTLTLTADDGTGSASDSMSVTIVNTPQPPRNIGGISLSSTESGVIEAVWDAPGETPVDYRISWAKTGEFFRTWTDISGNAFPTGASHTISDLEEGEEYKVKVRARYGSSSGLWSDASTVTVAGTG